MTGSFARVGATLTNWSYEVRMRHLARANVLPKVRFAPEAALGGLEIQLPPYPRNRTQLGNRGMSEMCQYRPKGLARSTYWREKIDSGGNAHSGSHARRSASIFREAGAR